MPAPTLLIADDHTLFREGIRTICETMGNFKVVGEAGTGREAVSLAKSLAPDIILLDINMPEMDGIRAAAEITGHTPGAKVIILTMFREEDHLFNAIKAGARGFILKNAKADELLAGIRAVLDGEISLPKTMAVKVLDEFRLLSRTARETGDVENLTPGEMDVLKQVAMGRDNRSIAQELDITEKTVSNRLSEIFSKLQVNNRTQAALHALRKGWASLDPEEDA